jgi:acetate kinase
MGFTPQAGVPMSTRCGDIDPFIYPYMLERNNMDEGGMLNGLTKRGGLLGISGLSGDVRDLEKTATQGNSKALLALEAYAYSVKKYIGAYAAALGGLDVLTFSGGIGENAVAMRARICQGLEFLGINIVPERNQACQGEEVLISKDGAAVAVWVVPTNEEIIVARETARLVNSMIS